MTIEDIVLELQALGALVSMIADTAFRQPTEKVYNVEAACLLCNGKQGPAHDYILRYDELSRLVYMLDRRLDDLAAAADAVAERSVRCG